MLSTRSGRGDFEIFMELGGHFFYKNISRSKVFGRKEKGHIYFVSYNYFYLIITK